MTKITDQVAKLVAPITDALHALEAANNRDQVDQYATRKYHEDVDPVRDLLTMEQRTQTLRKHQREGQQAKDKLLGEQATTLYREIRTVKPQLQERVVEHHQPPTSRDAWITATGRKPTDDQALGIDQLEVSFTLWAEPKLLGGWRPSEVLSRYQAALTDPHDQKSATLIRLVEEVHRDGWRGVEFDPKDGPQTAALRELRQLMTDTRDGRVPTELHEALATVEEANRVLGRTMQLEKIHFVR